MRNLRRVRLLKDRIAAAVGPPQGIGSLLPVLEEYEQIGSINAVAFPLCMYPTWSRLSCFAVGRDPVRPTGWAATGVTSACRDSRTGGGRARRMEVARGGRDLDGGSRLREIRLDGQERTTRMADQGADVPLAQPGLAPSITHQISRAYEPHRRVRKRPTRVVP